MFGESGHPCRVPDFSGMALSFSPFSLMLAVVSQTFLCMPYVQAQGSQRKADLFEFEISLVNTMSSIPGRIGMLFDPSMCSLWKVQLEASLVYSVGPYTVQSLRRSHPKRPSLTPQVMSKHEDFINSVMTGSFSIWEARKIPNSW